MNLIDFLQQNNTDNSDLYFIPDQINILDNNLTGVSSNKLIAELNTGTYVLTKISESDKSFVFDTSTGERFDSDSPKINEYLRAALDFLTSQTVQNKKFEIICYSDSIFNNHSDKNYKEINQKIFNGEKVTVASLKNQCNRLLMKCFDQTTEISLTEQSEYSIIYIDHNLSVSEIKPTIEKRAEELNEVMETINLFFEAPSLDQLSGADQDWLDKLIESEDLKKRLRHIVNQNTSLEIATELFNKGNLRKFADLMNRVEESMVLDFELSNENINTFNREVLNAEKVLSSLTCINEHTVGTLHLIETKKLSDFSKWLNANFNRNLKEIIVL
ncbi:MAG: hypothetical protein JXR65_12540 [Bacteroidales bacterium]|nr:hypothetical protein [Bacteroidales bacterium]